MSFNLNVVKVQRIFSLDPDDRDEKILEFSKIQEPAKNFDQPTEAFECQICFCEEVFGIGTTLCKHFYCLDCISQYVEVQIERLRFKMIEKPEKSLSKIIF